jgi:hypothetical protein
VISHTFELEKLGVSPRNTAATNSEFITKVLTAITNNGGGAAQLTTPGTYQVSSFPTLYTYGTHLNDNTEPVVRLGSGVTLTDGSTSKTACWFPVGQVTLGNYDPSSTLVSDHFGASVHQLNAKGDKYGIGFTVVQYWFPYSTVSLGVGNRLTSAYDGWQFAGLNSVSTLSSLTVDGMFLYSGNLSVYADAGKTVNVTDSIMYKVNTPTKGGAGTMDVTRHTGIRIYDQIGDSFATNSFAILTANNNRFSWWNNAGDGTIDVLKVDTSDNIEFGAAATTIEQLGTLKNEKGIYPGTDAGAIQAVTKLLAGSGAPNNANGADNDFYFRGDGTVAGNTVIYHKQGGSWVALTTA